MFHSTIISISKKILCLDLDKAKSAASKSFSLLKFSFRVSFRWIIDHLRFTIFVFSIFVFSIFEKGFISVNNAVVVVAVFFVLLLFCYDDCTMVIAFNENKEEEKDSLIKTKFLLLLLFFFSVKFQIVRSNCDLCILACETDRASTLFTVNSYTEIESNNFSCCSKQFGFSTKK